jgi:hypothetical protein
MIRDKPYIGAVGSNFKIIIGQSYESEKRRPWTRPMLAFEKKIRLKEYNPIGYPHPECLW